MLKKILCVLLSVLMVASLLPMGVVADGSHSITLYGAIDATLNYSSAEAGTVVTVTPGEGLGIYSLYFYLTDYTYMGEVEYTISDDHTSATFIMPDYDIIVSGEIVKESVHEFEYTLFGEYDWTIAQEDLEAYDGDDTEAKLLTWINSVMSSWDIDESIVWEASINYLSEPVAEDTESGVEAVDGIFGILIVLPNDYYSFGNFGTIVATTSSSSTEHDWNDGVITTAPTCTTAGVKTYTCTTCGETYTESVPATGHTAGTAVIENYVKVTADADGSYDTVTYCTVCGEEISRSHTVIAAYGSGSAEVIDWATVLACANSSNDTNTTTVEDVVIEEPIEPTDTETEDDGEEEPTAEPAVEAETPAETNPTTGVVISLIPMAIAALAVVSSKRK